MNTEMAEFRITSDLRELRSQAITTNYEEVKAWAESVASMFENIVVTEDAVSEAKKNRATLRRIQTNIGEVRKTGKEAALASYRPLENNCNELDAIIQRGVSNLDGQIKAFDEAKKAEKGERLRTFFNQSVGEMDDYLTFENIFNPRWLNATYAEEQARKDIICEIAKCANAVESLRALHSEFEMTLLDEFRRTHDLAGCLKRNENLTRIKEIEEARKRMRREQEQSVKEKIGAARLEADNAPQAVEPPKQEDAREVVHLVQMAEPQQMYEVVFLARGTAEQLGGLRQYMKERGIRFSRADR